MIPVYFMPGMAASQLIFENIKLPPDQFTMHFMHWNIPEKNESLQNYVTRLLEQIQHKNPVVIGVSFGGIVVQEIAKQIKVHKTIIISSAKTNQEFPRRMHFSKATRLHKVVPTRLFENMETLIKYSFGIAPKKLELYKKYLSVNDRRYLNWALDTIINWNQQELPENVVHIHGDKDPIFPIKYITNAIIVPDGTHIMIINRFRWFNDKLPQIILQ
ncbi:alpha/beta hydrolase [Nonlabens arenilitoris]|uniref:Alpha/beta hydrolase n=1 Tax=Nonlabens arenilitoris TaxID=1217969 RepID=A0A2S7UCQ4_9FLAO|nr:alpha/beta hydrolase [Nonlabens arenilitoris]PQJ32715.1 alpha/beta hydrolase [Nonlabens arenilitoris]